MKWIEDVYRQAHTKTGTTHTYTHIYTHTQSDQHGSKPAIIDLGSCTPPEVCKDGSAYIYIYTCVYVCVVVRTVVLREKGGGGDWWREAAVEVMKEHALRRIR